MVLLEDVSRVFRCVHQSEESGCVGDLLYDFEKKVVWKFLEEGHSVAPEMAGRSVYGYIKTLIVCFVAWTIFVYGGDSVEAVDVGNGIEGYRGAEGRLKELCIFALHGRFGWVVEATLLCVNSNAHTRQVRHI